VLLCFGYLDYAHRILHIVKHLNRKFFKLVALEQDYIRPALVIGNETFKLTNDVEFVRFRTQLNLHFCVVRVNVVFTYLERFLELSQEMPIGIEYKMQVTGEDQDGMLTERVLELGLKAFPNLDGIALNI